jgi:hypothetical protein
MRTVTLNNSFHNTEVRVRVPDDVQEGREWEYIQYWGGIYRADPSDRSRLLRVRRALCGSNECTCGTVR